MTIEFFAVIGFCLAAYSIIANDAIQTIGTFLSSNAKRPWWLLWAYSASILIAVMVYGYYSQGGDIAYGRLNRIPFPEGGIQWWHVVPSFVLILLTRFAIPVSTTFLVLTLFVISSGGATEGLLGKLLLKSGLGYVVAFLAGGAVYLLISRAYEGYIEKTKSKPHSSYWYVAQWSSTAFLWSQWLMQDLANIFVYMPRTTEVIGGQTQVTFSSSILFGTTALMVAFLGYIFWRGGGKIQEIVSRKVHTTDVRAGTIIDLMFGLILFVFKEISDIPMSTTWVFLGLLAGRELAISVMTNLQDKRAAVLDVGGDMARAFLGLVISIAIAVALPWIATGVMPSF